MVDDAEETYKRISALEDSVERQRSLAKSRLMIQIFKQNWSQAETGKFIVINFIFFYILFRSERASRDRKRLDLAKQPRRHPFPARAYFRIKCNLQRRINESIIQSRSYCSVSYFSCSKKFIYSQ